MAFWRHFFHQSGLITGLWRSLSRKKSPSHFACWTTRTASPAKRYVTMKKKVGKKTCENKVTRFSVFHCVLYNCIVPSFCWRVQVFRCAHHRQTTFDAFFTLFSTEVLCQYCFIFSSQIEAVVERAEKTLLDKRDQEFKVSGILSEESLNFRVSRPLCVWKKCRRRFLFFFVFALLLTHRINLFRNGNNLGHTFFL